MQKRQLGTSDLNVSVIGLGCMSLPTSVAEAKPIIETALANGINYFDTADLYDQGRNEEVVGELIKAHRKDIILATKVGNKFTPGIDGWQWDASKAHIEQGIKDSLRRMQTDYIDLYQLHGGTMADNWDNIIEVFEKLQQEGTVRAYGISSIRPNVLKTFLPQSNAKSVMMQYSLLDRRPEEYFEFIEEQGASVVTRGTLAKGLLTADWQNRVKKADGYLAYSQDELQHTLQSLAAQSGDLHALAIATNLQHKQIASTVIGASSATQLQMSIDALTNAEKLRDTSFTDDLTKVQYYTEHR